ncbi:GNAT family N-acetyltransferase [Fundicoccus culcitae]|uniref:GNAT family N-acetyltransferase n=1 Tax=Fundicoccus culcitae TaxID=2969821 RepID=A0ABY5P775_9LACT|nr:GNAT family N-acetyltransferase [Fundicoccus culcitae]UUX34293.1 GNAT family N-acetyltransferase [Fundicoccus culcitae]
MIRDVEINDAVWIHELNSFELGFRADYTFTKERLAHLLSKPEQHFIQGYEHNGKLVGYIHAQLYETLYDKPLANILALVVSEDNQGLGIGRLLIEALYGSAKEKGLAGIRINSGLYRENAHQYYEYMGFTKAENQMRYLKLFDDTQQ